MKVSVCIATYNGAEFIREQINSIIAQIAQSDEIIISDDNSSDNTLEIIRSLNDGRIKIFTNKGERGYTANFENALKNTSGDIIFLSDQDDVWLPEKYSKTIEYLSTCDLVVTNSMVTDEYLNITNHSFFTLYNSGTGILKNTWCNTYYGSCMAFNRRILQFALPFPANKEVGFDLWIGMVAEIVGIVKFIQTPFLLYRRSQSSVTEIGSLWSRSNRSLYRKLYKRIVILVNIFIFSVKYKVTKNKINHNK
jgi:glycosyltransferase involved in cell wall biosynthesis